VVGSPQVTKVMTIKWCREQKLVSLRGRCYAVLQQLCYNSRRDRRDMLRKSGGVGGWGL